MWSITIQTPVTNQVTVYSESQEKLNDIIEVIHRMHDFYDVTWETPDEVNLPIILE